MYSSGIIYPFHQNVIWTLLIGLWMIHLNEKAKSKIGRDNRKQMGLPVLNVTNRDGSKGGAHTSATTNTTQQIYGKN
jgi:hypothetical protein